MTREEIIKIFEENHIAKGNATINATKLAEIFTKHEADLLKEFVEWYKTKIINDRIKTAKEQEEYCKEIGEPMKAILWEYESNVLQRISYCLNNDLEKFLEERK